MTLPDTTVTIESSIPANVTIPAYRRNRPTIRRSWWRKLIGV